MSYARAHTKAGCDKFIEATLCVEANVEYGSPDLSRAWDTTHAQRNWKGSRGSRGGGVRLTERTIGGPESVQHRHRLEASARRVGKWYNRIEVGVQWFNQK